MGLMDYKNLRDMFDGGGAGQAGQKFEGGLFSGLLNSLGVNPMGADARMAESRPMARPAQPVRRYVKPAPQPVQQPIAQQPLVGGLTEADLAAAIDRGQPQMPSVYEMAAMDMQRRNSYGPQFKPTQPTLPPFWMR